MGQFWNDDSFGSLEFMRQILFGFILFFMSLAVFADPSSEALAGLLNQVQNMQTDFQQKITDKHGKVLQHSSGLMAIQRPGRFRWDVKKPSAQLIISNGQKLWVYDPDLAQVTIRVLSKDSGEAPALLLSDSQQVLEQKFAITTLQNNISTMRWFLLTPKNPGSVFVNIHVGFLNNMLHTLKFLDHLGQTTVIEFGSVKTNQNLSSSLFNFIPPKGVDVIDESAKQ